MFRVLVKMLDHYWNRVYGALLYETISIKSRLNLYYLHILVDLLNRNLIYLMSLRKGVTSMKPIKHIILNYECLGALNSTIR